MRCAEGLHASDLASGRKVQNLGDGVPPVPLSHSLNRSCICSERLESSAAMLVQQLLNICMAAVARILQSRHGDFCLCPEGIMLSFHKYATFAACSADRFLNT